MVSIYGPGSIVDTFHDSGTLEGLTHWPPPRQEDMIYEPRLERELGVDFFYQPPAFDDGDRRFLLPLVKFPTWHYCPHCHMLSDDFDPLERKRDGVRCRSCRKAKMTPARFVAACKGGHAQDFPFLWWAHGEDSLCKGQLSMKTLGRSSGLRDIRIDCSCGKGRSMEGAFGKDGLDRMGITCAGQHLWRDGSSARCEERPRALQRGASNFYYGEVKSSLSIPPWEGRVASVVRAFRTYYGGALPSRSDPVDAASLEKVLRLSQYQGVTVEDVFNWVANSGGRIQPRGNFEDFRREEFEAFHREINSDSDWPRFSLRPVPVPAVLQPWVAQMVLADMLEEVRALVGFRRVDPWSPSPSGSPEGNLVEIREASRKWLPGIRLTGEGIFVRFDPEPLDRWESSAAVRARVAELQREIDAKVRRGVSRPVHVTGRLLFLHSFAHSVMLRLSLDCGYSSGALRERIFSGDPSIKAESEMAGVLVHTGSTDSEGTLGGLVSMGEADTFESVVRAAVTNAAWCSSDPICSETRNSGEHTLNLAACHACLFVPETSCEYYNSLLDRHALVGDLGRRNGLLTSLI